MNLLLYLNFGAEFVMSDLLNCCIRYQASKDDLAVYAALSSAPSSEYVNVARWYSHIDALIRLRYSQILLIICYQILEVIVGFYFNRS